MFHTLQAAALAVWAISYYLQASYIAYFSAVLLLFYLVGNSIRLGLCPFVYQNRRSFGCVEAFVLDVLLSLIATSVVVSLLSFSYVLNPTMIMTSIVLIMVGMAAIAHLVDVPTENRSMNIIRRRELALSICVLLAVGFTFILVRMAKFPYPKTPGTDSFSHLAAIGSIVYENGTRNLLGAYSYIYHSIVASLSIVSGADTIWSYNALSYVLYQYSLVITFLFLFSVTKNAALSVLATCCTLAVYEHGGLLAPYYPFPSSFAFVFVFTIFVVSVVLRGKRTMLLLLLMAYIVAVAAYIHLVFATLPLFILLLVRGDFISRTFEPAAKALFVVITVAVLSTILLLYFLLPLLGYGPIEFTIWFITIKDTLDVAILQFILGYSIAQVLSLASGLLVVLYLTLKSDQTILPRLVGMDSELILLVTLTYLAVFFAPAEGAYRTEMFVRPFFVLLIVVAAYAVFSIAESLIQQGRPYQFGHGRTGKKTATVLVLALILLVPLNCESFSTQVTYILYGEPANPDFSEMDVFRWVSNHTDVGDYVLTDMASGYFMRGLVFRNSSTSFILDGISKSPYIHTDLAELVFRFMNCSEDEVVDVYYDILSNPTIQALTDGIAYIVITPRTDSWTYRARTRGLLGRYAPYRHELPTDDPAWTKWYSDKFTIVAESGQAMVLSINF